MMNTDFQQFQRAFAHHIRNPRLSTRPEGVPARGMAVYQELLFNNIRSFLDSCFPVCRSLLSETRWNRLCRTFYRDWPMHTPWFREIPREFVRYLAEARISQPLPRWFSELAHYEWAELAVDVMEAPIPDHDPAGDLLGRHALLNPALMNLAYHWPVHRIGPGYRPRKPCPSYLVVFRDADETVQFTEINAVTARLLNLLASAPSSGETALRRIAEELQHPSPRQLIDFGASTLAELRRQGIILGTAP
ncbi:MAG: putative DNA-binding domain-containing protein [Sulfurimicrobium sp.]|nr:putative DNA-binding domain-containing protein [Sulfurimicrobium sp.]MDP1703773.1 putative DNA-binding domain-containing protein [Sulfurimicrobium sp.]MDP2197983.1 putative DNA-binding domain-containing protein [Sulfurimicrobium sp.]